MTGVQTCGSSDLLGKGLSYLGFLSGHIKSVANSLMNAGDAAKGFGKDFPAALNAAITSAGGVVKSAVGIGTDAAANITKGVSIALPTGLGTAITDSVSSSTAKKAAKDAGKQAAADIAASANSGLWLSLTKGISNAIKAIKVDSAAAKKKADEIKKVLGDALGTAFGTFSSKALRAYDAETQTLTDKLRSDLSDQLQAIEDTLTASSDKIGRAHV